MNDLKEILPKELNNLAQNCPYPLYVVGGTCRDFLAGYQAIARDYDICAPVSAEEFALNAKQSGFTVASVYKNTGTVKLICNGVGYEFTSFRSDEYVRGKHSPEKVYFTDDIVKDAKRRDFKCNAVYYNICTGQFCDPLGGIEDIKAKKISCVAQANKVFGEDGLRLMRLCRQAAQLGFTPDEECMQGAKANCALIADISAERIWAELRLILSADTKYGQPYAHYNGVKLLKEIGVLAVILPELAKGDGMKQRSDYHNHDVLEHSLRCVMYAAEDVRLAALLHDVGKPYCYETTGKFLNHENVGADIADEICKRLKVANTLRERTVKLIRLHMYDFDCHAKEGKVRKFIVQNIDLLDDLLKLKQADFSACKDNLSVAPSVEKWKKVYQKMKEEGAPFTIKQLKIKGDDLINCGVPPVKVGKTLAFLLAQCACTPPLNEKAKLLKLGKSFAEQLK